MSPKIGRSAVPRPRSQSLEQDMEKQKMDNSSNFQFYLLYTGTRLSGGKQRGLLSTRLKTEFNARKVGRGVHLHAQ